MEIEYLDGDLITCALAEGRGLLGACRSVIERLAVVVHEGRRELTGVVWVLDVESMECSCPKPDKCVHHVLLYKGDMFSPCVFNRICQRLREAGFHLQGEHCYCVFKKNHTANMFPYKLCVH